jgi:repressor LexA
MKLHNIQRKILDLLTENTDYLTSSLRDIGEAIGEGRDQPQKINHHIKQLEKKGYLRKNPVTGAINASKE